MYHVFKILPNMKYVPLYVFVHAKGKRQADIQKYTVIVSINIVNLQNVTKRCCYFSGVRANANEGPTIDRPSAITDFSLSEYQLFFYRKKHLVWQNFYDNYESKIYVEITFRQPVLNFYDCEIQKPALVNI